MLDAPQRRAPHPPRHRAPRVQVQSDRKRGIRQRATDRLVEVPRVHRREVAPGFGDADARAGFGDGGAVGVEVDGDVAVGDVVGFRVCWADADSGVAGKGRCGVFGAAG